QQQPGAVAGGHQGDDRTDADDDAQAGQEGTPLVDQQGGQGNTDGGEEAHDNALEPNSVRARRKRPSLTLRAPLPTQGTGDGRTCATPWPRGQYWASLAASPLTSAGGAWTTSLRMRPSWTVITRGAQLATVASCVTRMIVWPFSRFSRRNSSRI